jgi:peptidyl-dipeptidase A
MDTVERKLLDLWIRQERTHWVQTTYITYDTNILAAQADEAVMEYVARKAAEATRFDGLKLPYALARKFRLLKLSVPLPAPRNPKERAELARIAAEMKSAYGKGKYCRKDRDKKCFTLGQMTRTIAKSRKHDLLLELWTGWRRIAPPLRSKYRRYVELANKGSKALGFANLADQWRSVYDMPPAEFEKEVDRLFKQVRPLYNELHCYVRARLQKKYGKDKVPDKAPIPAHLLGNMWAQDWSHIFDLVAPQKGPTYNLEKILKAKKVDEKRMVRYAEAFFVSLGLPSLPKSFWKRSMFVKPKDRDVVCHASAWDIDWKDDLRIKMCININGEDFTVIHHELGHNYYQRAYKAQPPLLTGSANDGFHEALGDTISLSVTPSYLVKVGLLKELPKANLNPLMKRALEKVAFLPFGLLMDKYRWGVFSGRIKPADYNKAWWSMRRRYQGIAPAMKRGEQFFDPGAKYHIPGSVPYARYFLAAILQFQFHRALCKVIGHKGPLHTCSIYGSKEAGKRLNRMMAMGMSRPWPEALKVLTGETRMDASAILDYFKPLHDWLKQQNKGKACGW